MKKKTPENTRKDKWYESLNDEERFVYDLICKYHNYFRNQDKKYCRIVRVLHVLILFFSMSNTIILGLTTVIEEKGQIIAGLVISALITFVTAITSYFNFEEYWMRNITIHIELNILRDNFEYDARIGKLVDKDVLGKYCKDLEDIQMRNIKYWQKSITKVK